MCKQRKKKSAQGQAVRSNSRSNMCRVSRTTVVRAGRFHLICRRFRLLRLRLCLAGTSLSLFADVLCQFAKEKAAHVLVIGHGGHSRKSTAAGPASTMQGATEEQKKLGSVVERCCELASMSVLITKGTGRHDQVVDGDGSTKMGNEVGGGG
eukprot:COSAG05_NODE_5190_length_1242_cov_0.937008_1_plen_151_part_10